MFNSNVGYIFTGWRHVYVSKIANNAMSWLSLPSKQRSLLSAKQHASIYIKHQYVFCISDYQPIYKHLVKEAKKRYNEKFILSSKNKTKGIWQVINRETGNFPHNNYNMQLQNSNEIITDPQLISEKFNSYFIDTVNGLLNKDGHNPMWAFQYDIGTCSSSMFASPITEIEIKNIISKLKENIQPILMKSLKFW